MTMAVAVHKLKGDMVYKIYKALTYGLSPLIHLHLHWRRLRGLEHPIRWRERLGQPSLRRPSAGPLLWFHAVSLGEGMAAIPVINFCSQRRPDINILMTTTTVSAFEVLKDRLPANVIYQFAPLDTPAAMDAFLGYWKPNWVVIMENELWPNLIMGASRCGIALALLNARLSAKSFRHWSRPLLFPLISLLLSQFSLIAPLSSVQAIHFQLLRAPPFCINFSGDLKYAVGEYEFLMKDAKHIEYLQQQLSQKQVWMAASIHRGEEDIILGVHNVLMQSHPDIVTIIVPRHPQHGKEIYEVLRKGRQNVALRSQHKELIPGTNIYLVDTLGELRHLYKLAPIAVIGGSFFPGLAGHNISEAAAAGCAVLTGHHIGHFSHMVKEMQQLNPLSVMQVSDELELEKALRELFADTKVLESRQKAAKESFHYLSTVVVSNAWDLLDIHLLRQVKENWFVQVICIYDKPPARVPNWTEVTIEGDSLDITNLLRGGVPDNSVACTYPVDAFRILEANPFIEVRHICRLANRAAHDLAHWALSLDDVFIFELDVSICILNIVVDDTVYG